MTLVLRGWLSRGTAPEEIVVDASTVGAALEGLARTRPELAPRLRTSDGRARPSVAVFRGDEDLRERGDDGARLEDGERLEVVPSISGGDLESPSPSPFRPEELARYGRHLVLPEVGPSGQRRLRDGRVLVVGVGGLGSPVALYLAAAGVGTIGLADFDRVQLSNLQRQVLFDTSSIGRAKVEAAKDRLHALNPEVRLPTVSEPISSRNARELVREYDVVVDGSDNFPTRYLVNDACVLEGRPDVFGSVYRFEGQVSVFDGRKGPCYRCLYPEPPGPEAVPSCADGGVLGVLPGLVGTLQAAESLKLLLGVGEPLIGRLLLVDVHALAFRELRLAKSPSCAVCSPTPTVTELVDYEAFCGVTTDSGTNDRVSGSELRAAPIQGSGRLLLDVRTAEEYEMGHLPGARSVPLDRLPDHAADLGTAEELIVYCNGGVRSSQAGRRLRDLGFRRVRRLEGGFEAWVESGGPVETGAGSRD